MRTTDTPKQTFLSNALPATRDPSALDMDAETFYQLGMQAVEIVSDYLEGIPEKPVYRPMTPSERQLLLYCIASPKSSSADPFYPTLSDLQRRCHEDTSVLMTSGQMSSQALYS